VEHHVILPPDLKQSQEAIAKEELDVAFYPEIGLDPQTYFLAFSRLAPVQLTTWGHPVTSGSPAIDRFLSVRDFERSDGQSEYTEKLDLLPDLIAYYEPPEFPPQFGREGLGLPANKRLYGCPQMPFKFHPDFDRVMNAILERDPRGVLVLVEPQHAFHKEILVNRWRKSYPGMVDRIVWLPPMPLPEYLRLVQLCDALLAPIQFGAGRSALDSFGVGAPMITFKGPFLKSRITYAMYMQIGMPDLIADSEEEYISLALKMAQDAEWRTEMKRTLTLKAAPLYESRAAVRELNDYLAAISGKG
jgi:predicted O-linked N-acetylglucosamine transferase (SPINDLY family)